MRVNLEHRKILVSVAEQVGRNPDVAAAVSRICLEWSHGESEGLTETYEIVLSEGPEEFERFMGMLSCLAKAGN